MGSLPDIIRRNLSLIFQEKMSQTEVQALVDENLLNMDRRWRHLEQLSSMGCRHIEEYLPEVMGVQYLENALKCKRGVILLSMHFFCCDLGLLWLSHKGFRMNLVYDSTEESRDAQGLLTRTFEEKGITLIKSSSSFKIRAEDREYVFRQNTLKRIVSILGRNEVVAMLPDMHPGLKAKGVYVFFLGHPTFVGYAPLSIARRTGATLVPALAVPTGDGRFKGIIHPPLSLIPSEEREEFYRINMQQYMDIVQSYVLKHPGEYCWHQPGRWDAEEGTN